VARAEREAMAKRPGVRIGMAAEEVINQTSWGKPLSIRRTTTASGVREQWIYDGNNYLYFENERLTAIQNWGARCPLTCSCSTRRAPSSRRQGNNPEQRIQLLCPQ
jgi:hypothetical protein